MPHQNASCRGCWLDRRFHAHSPHRCPSTSRLATESRCGRQLRRPVQLAFVMRPPKSGLLRGLRFETLRLERIRLAVAPTHRLARQPSVSLAEAAREPFIRLTHETFRDYYNYFTAIFARTKIKPHVLEELEDISGVISSHRGRQRSGLSFRFLRLHSRSSTKTLTTYSRAEAGSLWHRFPKRPAKSSC
jgi:LysR substrate binding domain